MVQHHNDCVWRENINLKNYCNAVSVWSLILKVQACLTLCNQLKIFSVDYFRCIVSGKV